MAPMLTTAIMFTNICSVARRELAGDAQIRTLLCPHGRRKPGDGDSNVLYQYTSFIHLHFFILLFMYEFELKLL